MFYFYDSFYDPFKFILQAGSLDGNVLPAWLCGYRNSTNAVVTPWGPLNGVPLTTFVLAETLWMKCTCQLCGIQRNQITHHSDARMFFFFLHKSISGCSAAGVGNPPNCLFHTDMICKFVEIHTDSPEYPLMGNLWAVKLMDKGTRSSIANE